jgi:hypothetical protein
VKNDALEEATKLRSLELVQLLLAHGAEINGVAFADVLLTWEPALIRLFLNSGADVVTGLPFAEAFGDKVRTALRPFIEYKKIPSRGGRLVAGTGRPGTPLFLLCRRSQVGEFVDVGRSRSANQRTRAL